MIFTSLTQGYKINVVLKVFEYLCNVLDPYPREMNCIPDTTLTCNCSSALLQATEFHKNRKTFGRSMNA